MTNQEAIEILEHLKGVNPQSLHKPNEQIEAYDIAINALKNKAQWNDCTEVPQTPKFKVGDWLWHKEKGVFPVLIAGYDEEQGYFTKYIGSETYFGRDVIENEYRLWTIADAKDGDVLANCYIICIYRKPADTEHCIISSALYTVASGFEITDKPIGDSMLRPATKNEREKLFSKMKEAGYKWDAYEKELKKIKSHYDIANFDPFDSVLVRDGDKAPWRADFFEEYDDNFYCFRGAWECCIPYNEDTKHLLGTTDPCDECYINW